MSSSSIPVNENASPFVPTTTPAIELSNRLISLRAHPGFLDLLRLSQELVQEAADICAEYPGWDAQQIVVLKVRMQCAREHHRMLITKLQEAINNGVAEARTQMESMPVKTAEDMIDQGDYVRQKVLQNFETQDERRIPGSF